MIVTEQIVMEKILPFDADVINAELKKRNIKALRWVVVQVTNTNYVLDVIKIC